MGPFTPGQNVILVEFPAISTRRDGRVVDGGGLENHCTGNRTGGSNPSPSASIPASLSPPLKWAGGKRWQISYLEPLWRPHAHRRLVEPFCGGLAVTLGLGPDRALLNDINPHLINFYRWLKQGLQIDIHAENDAAVFYRHRRRFNA